MGPLRILVVEDDALIGMLLADMLDAMGHTVCAVARTQARLLPPQNAISLTCSSSMLGFMKAVGSRPSIKLNAAASSVTSSSPAIVAASWH